LARTADATCIRRLGVCLGQRASPAVQWSPPKAQVPLNKVKSRKQAIAIALSKARKKGKKVLRKKR
jgi:hypothetical protein